MKRKTITTIGLIILLISSIKTKGQTPFELNPNGHIIIRAMINGVEGNFIFDTGAGLNVVFTKFSSRLENHKTNSFFVGHRATGEQLNVALYNATNFKINNKEFDDQQYAIVDLEVDGIDGLISLQPFRNTAITIDYINQTILFDKPTNNEKSIDIQLADYAGKAIDIFTYVQLNDTLEIQTLLDSGAGKNSFWVSSQFLEPLALNKVNFKTVPVISDFEKQNMYYIGKLAKLNTTNKIRILEGLDVAFVDGLIYEGKTSIDWLGRI